MSVKFTKMGSDLRCIFTVTGGLNGLVKASVFPDTILKIAEARERVEETGVGVVRRAGIGLRAAAKPLYNGHGVNGGLFIVKDELHYQLTDEERSFISGSVVYGPLDEKGKVIPNNPLNQGFRFDLIPVNDDVCPYTSPLDATHFSLSNVTEIVPGNLEETA